MPLNKRTFFLLLIPTVYLFTAINSIGYHHPDEHYQIIEFAGLKGGWNTGEDLAWEYDAQIRPTLQPMLALAVFKVLNSVGITNPFQLSAGLRILTAIFAVFCISYFIRSFLPVVKESNRTAFVLLSFLLWFLPAISVRFSSETYAGLTLLLSVALLYPFVKRNAFFYAGIGILWGLCFEFRYQMAIPLLGLFFWLIFIQKEKIYKLLYLLMGGIFVVACCFLLDSWYYEDWVFTPWNYFQCAFIDHSAPNFGESPWYFYLEEIRNRPTPLIGLLILAALIVFLVRHYWNPVAWCVIPFLLIHSLIPHKELRFLFPVVYFVPIILILAFQEIPEKWDNQIKKAVFYPIFAVAALINAGGLVMLSFKPASDGNIAMLQYIRNHYGEAKLYTAQVCNPYILNGDIKGLTPRFYADDKVDIKNLPEVMKPKSKEKLHDRDLVMLWASSVCEREYVEQLGFREEHRSIPRWIEKMDLFYKVFTNYDYIYVLYSKN